MYSLSSWKPKPNWRLFWTKLNILNSFLNLILFYLYFLWKKKNSRSKWGWLLAFLSFWKKEFATDKRNEKMSNVQYLFFSHFLGKLASNERQIFFFKVETDGPNIIINIIALHSGLDALSKNHKKAWKWFLDWATTKQVNESYNDRNCCLFGCMAILVIKFPR